MATQTKLLAEQLAGLERDAATEPGGVGQKLAQLAAENPPREIAATMEQAAEDLQADALLPGHVGKFSLARHSWDDPYRRLTAASEGRSYRLLTPMIGSPIVLDDQQQRFSRWWEDLAQPPADRTAGASSAMRGQMGVLSKQVEIVAASKEGGCAERR